MSSANLDLHDGYNCAEMWWWCRTNGRLSTFDDLKHWLGATMRRRRGSVIEFGRIRVAKCPCPAKNIVSDFVAHPVLNIDVTLLLEKIRLKVQLNFWYFATMTQLDRSMCFFCGLGARKRTVLGGLCGSYGIFPVLRWPQKPDEVQLHLKVVHGVLILGQSCRRIC